MWPQDIEAIAEVVIRRAEAKGLIIATAESCTGGLVSGALTAIAGSSAVLDRGF
ncbi:CinA family protein, partial [Brevundimonas diminuta]|uniref:CinA family protein n=1 Tax=Brevundimonas diminuta TaxID=293 RepID=UPI00209236B1